MSANGKEEVYIDVSDGEIPPDEREMERAQTIRSFLDKFGVGVAKISLFKIRSGNARPQWLYHYMPEELDEEVIYRHWGPGSYLLKLLDEQGQYVRQRNIDIGSRPGDPEPGPFNRNQIEPGARAAGASEFPPWLMVQMEQQREASQRQHEMMLALIKTMGGGGGSLKDVVEAMVLLKGEADPLKQTAEILKISRELGSSDGGGSGWGSILKEVAPAVAEFLPSRRTPAPTVPSSKPLSRPRDLPPANGNGIRSAALPAAPAEPEARPPTPEASEEGLELLRAQINYWKTRARAGTDPVFWVDYVFQNPDEPAMQAVTYAVRHFGFDQLVANDAELADPELRPWFLELYNGIRAELELEPHVDTAPRGARDMANSPGDGVADSEGGAGRGDAGGGGDSDPGDGSTGSGGDDPGAGGIPPSPADFGR